MLGGKSPANDTSHCGHRLAVDAIHCLRKSNASTQDDLMLFRDTWRTNPGYSYIVMHGCDT